VYLSSINISYLFDKKQEEAEFEVNVITFAPFVTGNLSENQGFGAIPGSVD
jgi:hypothetical protein